MAVACSAFLGGDNLWTIELIGEFQRWAIFIVEPNFIRDSIIDNVVNHVDLWQMQSLNAYFLVAQLCGYRRNAIS